MNTNFEQGRNLALETFLTIPIIWKGTPEDFLTLVWMTEHAANPMGMPVSEEERANGLSEATESNIAAALLEVMIVDFYPYQDFEDLKNNGTPGFRLAEESLKALYYMTATDMIDEVIKPAGITMQQETIPMDKIISVWAGAFINRASKHMKFDDLELSSAAFTIQLSPELITYPFVWNASAEHLLELIIEFNQIALALKIQVNETDKATPTIDNLASALMNITAVTLQPYKNWEDLKVNGKKTTQLKGNLMDCFATRLVEQFNSETQSILTKKTEEDLPPVIEKDLNYVWANFFIATAAMNIELTDIDFLNNILAMMLARTSFIGVHKSISPAQQDRMIRQYKPFSK